MSQILYWVTPEYSTHIIGDGSLHYKDLNLTYFEDEVGQGVHGPQTLSHLTKQEFCIEGEFAVGSIHRSPSKWELQADFAPLRNSQEGRRLLSTIALPYDAGYVAAGAKESMQQECALVDHLGHYLASSFCVDFIAALTPPQQIPQVRAPHEEVQSFVDSMATQFGGLAPSPPSQEPDGHFTCTYPVLYNKEGLACRVLERVAQLEPANR